MADGRSRKDRRKRRAKGCLCALVLTVLIGAGAAYALPRAVSGFGGSFSSMFANVFHSITDRAVEEAASLMPRQETEFPELTVSVEEVQSNFYYQQLTENEQTVYRELLQGVNGMEERILLHAGSNDDPAKVYEYLMYDRPELFWCDGNSQMTVYPEYTEFYPGYTCSSGEKELRQAEIESAASSCLTGISQDASEYERIRYVYEYIVNTVDYDESAPDNQNIYSSLVGTRSVCAGYSRAAQYLLRELGIECIYVVGTIENQGAHAWNIVNCGGNYYQMDVTFADPVFYSEESGETLPGNIINYDYLCCTDSEIMTDHIQSDEVAYPPCYSDDLNYYKMNGMYYDSFDAQILLSDMNNSIYAGEEMFVCKFPDAGVYAVAKFSMVNDLFPAAARTLASVYGLDSVKYTYVEDDNHYKMMVFWSYE